MGAVQDAADSAAEQAGIPGSGKDDGGSVLDPSGYFTGNPISIWKDLPQLGAAGNPGTEAISPEEQQARLTEIDTSIEGVSGGADRLTNQLEHIGAAELQTGQRTSSQIIKGLTPLAKLKRQAMDAAKGVDPAFAQLAQSRLKQQAGQQQAAQQQSTGQFARRGLGLSSASQNVQNQLQTQGQAQQQAIISELGVSALGRQDAARSQAAGIIGQQAQTSLQAQQARVAGLEGAGEAYTSGFEASTIPTQLQLGTLSAAQAGNVPGGGKI